MLDVLGARIEEITEKPRKKKSALEKTLSKSIDVVNVRRLQELEGRIGNIILWKVYAIRANL